MHRFLLLSSILLMAGLASAETPTVVSGSSAYTMESTITVAGISETFQESGAYMVASEMDSAAVVPVELSSFDIE